MMKTIIFVTTILCTAKFTISQRYDPDSYNPDSYSPDAEDRDNDDDDHGFVTPLDFSPLFGGGVFGLSNSGDKKSIFDVGGSESRLSGQNNFQSVKQFSPENFDFIPLNNQNPSPKYYQPKLNIPTEKPRPPLQFNIQTKHDNKYKKPEVKPNSEIYVPSSNSKILQPKDLVRVKNEDHLGPYKKYSFQPIPLAIPNYQALTSSYANVSPFAPLSGLDSKLYRHKRYSGDRRKKKPAKIQQETPDYDSEYYSSDYKSRPREFDESSSYYKPDFSEFDENKKEYDYGSDDEYNFDEYEKIKSISQQQAAEAGKNPNNCKKVQKDSMTCMVCQNPENGGNYESCSYVSEPKNNKYAYVKEQKFDSNDEPEEQEETSKQEQKQKPIAKKTQKSSPYRGISKFQQDRQPNYQRYTKVHNPIKQDQPKDYDDNYDYKSDQADFFTDNEPKKNVEHVLAEFAKKDRSACKKVYKNEMTCYQCTDKTGLKHEECMYVSESAPKTSHLAYKEVKEFKSKPDEAGNTKVESTVPFTSTVLPATTTTASNKKLFKKYTRGGIEKKVLLNPRPVELSKSSPIKRNVKRSSSEEYIHSTSETYHDETGDPEAFWTGKLPRHTRQAGSALPDYLLSKSQQEKSFYDFLKSSKLF